MEHPPCLHQTMTADQKPESSSCNWYSQLMEQQPISVCMISGPESRRIRRALESVAGWTTEIIVVLNEEVADGTDQIAHEFGAKVYRERWKGYVPQKNSAAEKASQPWLLGLDADEVVSPGLQREIADAIAAEARCPRHAAYSFPRCTFFAGKWIRHGDWYPDRKVLLWRRGHARWAGVEPHAALEVSGSVGRLKHDLQHYSMENLDHFVRKSIDYSDYFVRHAAAMGLQASCLDIWGRSLWRFVRSYFLRLGFLDGWQGYCIARMTAFQTFLRYAKLRERAIAQRDTV
jgi:glycosyltransferase involved in cell wall biosynthesis